MRLRPGGLRLLQVGEDLGDGSEGFQGDGTVHLDRGQKLEWEPLRILASQVERLEQEIDLLNGELSDLTSFVLPGGTPAAAALHLARTVCRRAEREAVALAGLEDEVVSPEAVKFLNRLSDLLFVASRWANGKGSGDVLWTPGGNR